ncbi:helix-turn-helix domain-containing protein [Micromonospora endolithica]|uniref:XRE family transcriptional regulator n=1 Tax=Micromonospora endolithica TaxID=230091 RepID=A0A3A9ZQ99_9ACTN|nr:helix-turn-helix transcriptional regulator [Micromonospora endolithica]RKN50440.1 XRE family transcriptional regulator [Micromonospora endolithica]TWJ20874.1 helix-turn-helix protein [Micromonospora endolithica]
MSSVPPQDVAKAWIALGQMLARSRKAAGYTQETFAPRVSYGRSTIANVETGRQRVGRDFWTRSDEVLGTGGRLSREYDRIRLASTRYMPSGMATTQTFQAAADPSSSTAVETVARTPGTDYLMGEWNSFSTLTSMLAQQRQAVSPDALLGLIEAHRDCLSTLYRKAGRAPIRADIGAMLAEASIVASRLWSAQGNRGLALAHCAYSRQLGDRLGSRRISATARIFESNLHSEAATLIDADGDIMIGLRLLDEAARASTELSPAARARVAAEQAQAYAALRLPREATAALARAKAAVNDVSPADCVGLYSDWSGARLHVYAGTCHLLLGQPHQAVTVLESAVQMLEHDHANVNVALAAAVDLASAYAEAGELEQSCTLLGNTYDQLKAGGNHRGIARAQRARQRLARWRDEPVVLELEEQMAA